MSLLLPKTCNMGSGETGLVGTIGVALYNPDGSIHTARTTVGIYEIGANTGCYGKEFTFPDNWKGSVFWDTSGESPGYAVESYDIGGIVESVWKHERAESILYDGVGVIDVVNGEAGTTPPIGTPKRPSNNLTDALSIISGENINKILLRSDIIVESYHDIRNLAFETHGSPIVTVTLEDGCLVHNSSFRYIHLQGTISGEQYMLLEACAIDNLTNFNGFMNLVAFSQGSEISIGAWANLIDCHAGGEPGNEPEIDIGSSNLKLQKYTGNVKFTNKTGSNRTIANFSSGNVIIDSTCVAGKIQLLGVGDLEADNSGVGCSVDTDSFISNKFIADHVLDEAISEHLAVGSLGDYIAKTLGLSQDKYYLDQTVYSTYNGIKLLTSGRIRTYTNPASIGTDADVLATYTITAVWNNDELQSYKVVPI